MDFLNNKFEIDSSDKTVFAYTPEEEKIIIKEAEEFERNQIIAEHKAIESARALILTD